VEVRSSSKGKKIRGYAAVFAPAKSEDFGGWVETLAPHCFDASLASPDLDVVCVFNHNQDGGQIPLGRTKSGTLRLSVDSKGLRYECDPPNTQLANDLIVSMQRGDITASSFAFICTLDRWDQLSDGTMLRTVLEATLLDCSPVVTPAYPDATSAYRNMPAALRAKLKRDADDDCDEDEQDEYGNCPGDPDYEGDDDEDDDRSDKCQCDCRPCQGYNGIPGDCVRCERDNCAVTTCRCERAKEANKLRAKLGRHMVKAKPDSRSKYAHMDEDQLLAVIERKQAKLSN
jgi:hypothetical protein